MKKVGIILTLLLVLFGLTACQSIQKTADTQDTWPKIEHKKEVVVGLDDSFVPMGFVKRDGELTGYDVDLARAVFKLYGIHVDFQTIDLSMNATELRNGTIDLIWNGYSITPQRKRKVAFSKPYLANGQVLVVKKKSGIQTFAQIKNKEIGMQTGSTAQQWYDSSQHLLKAKHAILYDQVPNSFLDLNANRIQGILLDEVYANYYVGHLHNKADYMIIKNKHVPQDLFAVGMRKGDRTLRHNINHGLTVLQKNGTLAKLNEKWFNRKSSYLGK